MVRLKEQAIAFVIFPCSFQFHYGTIKRQELQKLEDALAAISIPLWYD